MADALSDRLANVAWRLQVLRVSRAQALVRRGASLRGDAGSPWHTERAQSLGIPINVRMAHCDTARAEFFHEETGEIAETVGGCGQPLCVPCQKRRRAQVREWLGRVVAAHHERERAEGRAVVMLTCSVRHRGVAEDAAALRRAWPRLRAAFKKREGFSFTYFRAEECPPGGCVDCGGAVLDKHGKPVAPLPGCRHHEGGGHVHWHVVAWWPKFVDYSWLQHEWWRAIGWDDNGSDDCGPDDNGLNPRCNYDRPCARHTPGTVHVERKRDVAGPERAIAYATKAFRYATKFNTEIEHFDSAALATYLDARWGRRVIQGSVGFWSIVPKPRSSWILLDKCSAAPPPAARRWWEDAGPGA